MTARVDAQAARASIAEALDLGLMAWRTTPARDKFFKATDDLNALVGLLADAEKALRDIRSQATRQKRASDLKRYLVTDLEIIERKADAVLAAFDAAAAAPSPADPNRCEKCGDPRDDEPTEAVEDGRQGWKCETCRWWNWLPAPSPADRLVDPDGIAAWNAEAEEGVRRLENKRPSA